MRHFKLIFVSFQMRELEVVQKTRENNFANLLHECLAQTNADTAKKRTETVGVSFFTAWSQANRVGVVEALWYELAWLLPLLGIVA